MTSATLVLAALALVTLADSTPSARSLPREIQEHYRDYNFVNAFSTLTERRLVAERAADPSHPRLARVARAMRRLAAGVHQIDPGFVMPSGRRWPETTGRADLLRITDFELDEAHREMSVHLEALALDPPANAALVSAFDDLAAEHNEPSVDQLVAAATRPLVRTFEIHRWVRIDGRWQRESAVRVFLAL